MPEKNQPEYEMLFKWKYLEFDLPEDKQRVYMEKEYYKGAMPAACKTDSAGVYYISVPRWDEGIPATLNTVVEKNGKYLLRPFPSPEMNTIGDPNALQSVLGLEIDENDVMWILDQGHIQGARCIDGAQKILKWDLRKNKLVDIIKIPNEISSYEASFLNDLVVDNRNGFAYIADSGIFTDPLEGGLIVVNTRTNQLRRVLHQHESTQDAPGFTFAIDGHYVHPGAPMRTGADGIALSGDRETLYWCPLTGRNLYCIPAKVLRNWNSSAEVIEAAVVDLGSKGTNTDGMAADNQGRVWYTMLEDMGVGYYDSKTRTFNKYFTHPLAIWVDTPQITNDESIILSANRLHFIGKRQLDYDNPDNLIIWKVHIGGGTKSYLKA
jgi:sugar lactone lactonase YvrE